MKQFKITYKWQGAQKMKLIIAMLLMCSTAYAGEINVQLRESAQIRSGDMTLEAASGVEAKYIFDNQFYVFGSQETAELYGCGKIADYSLTGLGVGIHHPISKHIKVFGQVGYYDISNSWGARRREHSEALAGCINGWFVNGPTISFDEFGVENKNAIGMLVGFELVYPVSENFSAGFTMSYRSMTIRQVVYGIQDGYRFDETGDRLEKNSKLEASTINTGIVLTYRF